jgi:uncharacterized protein with von Willebrand factor type A (vWA) domain
MSGRLFDDRGNRMIGTGGTSPFGQHGQHPKGMRVGSEGGQRVEALQRSLRKPHAEGLHQDAPFGECDGNLMTSERVEKVEEHT